MAQSQWIVLLVAAAIAVAVLVRLFMVLGRRNGTELPATRLALQNAPEPMINPLPPAPEKLDAPGLFELRRVDRSFDAEKFLGGARTAYAQIVGAFETGDAAALKPLVSPDVLDGFVAAIAARGGVAQRFHFSAVKDAAIDQASVHGNQMEITVRFDAAFETAEAVGAPHEITDHWTFSRAVGSSDPNWILVATSGEAA